MRKLFALLLIVVSAAIIPAGSAGAVSSGNPTSAPYATQANGLQCRANATASSAGGASVTTSWIRCPYGGTDVYTMWVHGQFGGYFPYSCAPDAGGMLCSYPNALISSFPGGNSANSPFNINDPYSLNCTNCNALGMNAANIGSGTLFYFTASWTLTASAGVSGVNAVSSSNSLPPAFSSGFLVCPSAGCYTGTAFTGGVGGIPFPSTTVAPTGSTACAGTTLTDGEVARLVIMAGVPSSYQQYAIATVFGESGARVSAINTANANGTVDRGLWQINSVHTQFDATRLLNDPFYNAAAMMQLSGGGVNWQPWGGLSYPAHVAQMTRAGIALANPASSISCDPTGTISTTVTSGPGGNTRTGNVIAAFANCGVVDIPCLIGSAFVDLFVPTTGWDNLMSALEGITQTVPFSYAFEVTSAGASFVQNLSSTIAANVRSCYSLTWLTNSTTQLCMYQYLAQWSVWRVVIIGVFFFGLAIAVFGMVAKVVGK